MTKPRVIVCMTAYAPLVGGAEIAVEETLRRYKDRFDFFIVTSRFRRDLPKREAREEGLVVRLGLGTRFDKWTLPFLGFAWGAARLLQRRPTILWAMDISQGAMAALFLKMLFPRTPLIFTIQYGEDLARLRRGRGGAIGKIFSSLLRHADYVTAISTYLLDLSRAFGYLGPAQLIHNGVNFSLFRNGENNRTKEKRGKTVITISRLVPKNGVDILIRAVAEVKKTVPDIKCVVIGDGPQRAILESLAASLHLENQISFLGTVPNREIQSYLWGSDVFVRPSRSEGMGNAFIEALAAGIPIIGTPVGGIPDIITDEQTGLFVEAENPSDCARKIVRLLYDDGLSQKIAKHGSALVERLFSWNRIGSIYAELFSNFFSAEKRVLIVTGLFPPDMGGPATYAKLLRDDLLPYGIVPAILYFGSVRHWPVGARHILFFWKIFCATRGRDIIYAQDPVSVGFPARLAALFSRKPLLLKIVGDYAWEQSVQRFQVTDLLDEFVKKKYGWRVEFLKYVERFVAQGARSIIVPSQYLKNIVVSWGIGGNGIEIIHNAHRDQAPVISKESSRRALGLFGTALVSVGRLVPWKGFVALVEILPPLLQSIPDIALFIAGQGPEYEKIILRSRDLGIADRVRVLGVLASEDVLRLLRGGNIFVLNSAYEGFSHTLLEAMASHIPVVATSVGGNPELIENGVSGLLVAYGDNKGLIDAIKHIAEDPVLRRRLITGAGDRLHFFSEDIMFKKTAQLIKTL